MDKYLYFLFLAALAVYLITENIKFSRRKARERREYERLRDLWFTKKTVVEIGPVTMAVAGYKGETNE